MASKWQNDSGAHPIADEPVPSGAPAESAIRRSALLWSGIGFVAGSLFWSVINGNSPLHLSLHLGAAPQQTASITTPEKLSSRLSDAIYAESGCTALVLDRFGQETRADHCPDGHAFLEHLAGSGRQDRLPAGNP